MLSQLLRPLGLSSLGLAPLSHHALRMSTAVSQTHINAETDVERKIAEKVARALTSCSSVLVRDTSGGCGAMYDIEVVAEDFKAMNIVKQHQAVHKALKEEIAQWHGLNLVTRPPKAG